MSYGILVYASIWWPVLISGITCGLFRLQEYRRIPELSTLRHLRISLRIHHIKIVCHHHHASPFYWRYVCPNYFNMVGNLGNDPSQALATGFTVRASSLEVYLPKISFIHLVKISNSKTDVSACISMF